MPERVYGFPLVCVVSVPEVISISRTVSCRLSVPFLSAPMDFRALFRLKLARWRWESPT